MKIKKWIAVAVFGMSAVVLAGCSGKTDKQILKGNQAIEAGNYGEALEIFTDLKKSDGNKTEIYRGIGISSIGLGDYEGGIKALEKSLKQSDGLVGKWEYDTSYYLALAYEKNGQRKKAIEVYTNILNLRQEEEAYLQRGILYLKNGKTKKAEADFDKAVELDKKNPALCIEIYEQWESAGQEGGEKYLQLVLDGKARDGEELYYRGLAYEKLGEKNAAIDTLLQAVEKGCSKANLALGRLYEAPDSIDAAFAYYEAYLEANPGNAKGYEELAGFEIRNGEYEAALATIQDGLSAEEIKDTRGLQKSEIACYEYLQNYETARDKAEKYLESWPDDEDVQKELEFLLTR